MLPVQLRHSRQPGDTPASLQARQRFLNAGHYAPLQTALQHLIQNKGNQPVKTLLDIGCAEGYYTAALVDQVQQVIGLDIAKAGIQQACQRSRNIQWLVGSAYHLPIQDTSQDVVLSLFAPTPFAEVQRVLQSDGLFIVVKASEGHLYELREALFGQVIEPQRQAVDSANLQVQHQAVLAFPLTIKPDALDDLIQMTPYTYRAKAERLQTLRQQVLTAGFFTTQAKVEITVWHKSKYEKAEANASAD